MVLAADGVLWVGFSMCVGRGVGGVVASCGVGPRWISLEVYSMWTNGQLCPGASIVARPVPIGAVGGCQVGVVD